MIMSGREDKDRFAKARQRMVRLDLMGRDIADPDVLRAMERVRREEFVPQAYRSQAYDDCPLPIGMDQTISQPYIVALMTQELRLNGDCEVLEIGTGSGYQTAVLCKLVKKVYTIERVAELSEMAQAVLARLGIEHIEFCVGDGSCGWPMDRWEPVLRDDSKSTPCFDRIVITAAVPRMPEPLVEQLAEGGIIVGPVGSAGVQELIACEKKSGRLCRPRVVCDCRFVRLLGEFGFSESE
jgi:protein-L-isoaspartate(D-aspartate) O-methyltransferase